MNPDRAPELFSPAAAVDRACRTETPVPPAAASQPLPAPDASEPAELVPVAVRGYN